MAQGQTSTAVADAPDTLPSDFFDKKKATSSTAPDTLPADFFDKAEDTTYHGEDEPKAAGKENLPGATSRLKASPAASKFPITRFETEHTPAETGPWARLKQYAGDVGGMATGLGEMITGGPASSIPKPGRIADIGLSYARRAIPNTGQEGMPGARSPVYNALATGASIGGIDPSGMEESAERGDPTGVLTHAAAQVTPVVAGELARVPAVRKAVGKVIPDLPTKADIAMKLRDEETGKLKPGVTATARLGGAALGHAATYAGIPLVGELGGYAVGPGIADALIPDIPFDRPVKTSPGAPLPSIEDFYEHRAQDVSERGEQQATIDKANAKRLEDIETARQKELADQEKLKEQHAQALMRREKEQAALDKAQPEPAANPAFESKVKPTVPKIISPTEGEAVRAGNEGRPATWTNEYVLEKAAKGSREGISQAILRGLKLPENARYVMGDPDTARAVLNPREVTRFTPEGEPIRNKENPFTQEPTARIPTIQRTPRPAPVIPQLAPLDPTKVLPFPGPMPETEAAAVGARPPVEAPPIAAKPVAAAPAPTLLEPIPPMGIKPLEGVKPIMEGTPAAGEPIGKEEPEPEEVKIKGITAEEPKTKGGAKKAKAVPIEKRFGQDEIQAAEGMLASESGAMLSADKPGSYFDEIESTAEGRKGGWKTGLRKGGQWRGVTSGREMYPFMSENPDLAPSQVQKALRNKDSAAYQRLIEKAVEFNRRQTAPAYDFLRNVMGGNPDVEPETGMEGETEFNPEQLETPEEQNVPRGTIPPIEEPKAADLDAQLKKAGDDLVEASKQHKSGAISDEDYMKARKTHDDLLKEWEAERGEAPPTGKKLEKFLAPAKGETGVIPGMEEHVAKQKEGAAKVAGENLTAEVNKPRDITQAAGRMETLSPLFRGTEASPQREIFGNAPATNTPPPAIQAAIEGTDWKFAGKNNLGLYTIEEPGTKIRISLFERDLHPEFIRRKIAEKEKQFGAPEK